MRLESGSGKGSKRKLVRDVDVDGGATVAASGIYLISSAANA